MKVLITGGNGFLGSTLSKHLLMQGYDICIASRNCYRIQDILERVTFFETSDVCATHPEELIRFCPNIVIDCAWNGGNNYNQVNSLDQFRLNMDRSIGLLETMRKMEKIPMFMGFGSFAEYGMIRTRAEEHQTEMPVTFYGLAKTSVKEMSRLFCEQNDIKWTWIRPCYIYGPNDVPTRLIPKVIHHLLKKQPLVLNSCNTTIDYLHVYDFCTAISALIETQKTGVFNICSGNEYRLLDAISLIQTELGLGDISYDELLSRDYSPKYICGSNRKIKQETGWNPTIDLHQGIIDTICKTNLSYKGKD
jgi:dTDP-6-deoxy-L-talose 4-dehydrogenase (NAD+)